MDNVKMLYDRILVQPYKIEEPTSVMEVTRANQPNPCTGVVVAVGPGKVNNDGVTIPLTVKVGDQVRFVTFGHDEWKKDGVDFLIMEEKYLLCVILPSPSQD